MEQGRKAGGKQVGINAQLLSGTSGYRRAGIHHYIGQLLLHLPVIDDGLQFSVYTNGQSDLNLNQAVRILKSRWPTSNRVIRIMWEQLIWPVLATWQRLDLLHSLAFVTPVLTQRPTVVTVYDLSFIHFPERFPRIQRAYLTTQTRRSCHQAKRVVTISEYGRQDIHNLFGIPLEQIDVVFPGVDPSFSPRQEHEINQFLEKNKLHKPYILHVGTLQPRKNIPNLIDAFASLSRSNLELILVGGKGWLYEEIFNRVQQAGLSEQVRFTGYVDDQDLPLWYNGATMVVLPSVYEGFGMPVIQAMACGTPVIASDVSAIPEVAGSAALLFDPNDVSSLVEHMRSVLDDGDLRVKMQSMGLDRAQKFTWQNAGLKMYSIYEKVLAEA